jgi:1,4-alpha-glucan branching enzyme
MDEITSGPQWSRQTPTVYEVHLGSWKRHAEDNRFLTYLDFAEELVNYVKRNRVHMSNLCPMEYPYDPSWGYQLVGYFAPTSRFGNHNFMVLVDKLPGGYWGILDWVPSISR